MIVLAFSAAFVGFVHSLAPGHWLPVVLMAKVRQWSPRQSALGALVAACGHIVVSVGLGALALFVNERVLRNRLHEFEERAGWILVFFGLAYAAWSHFRHRQCHGHEHHGPEPRANERAPYLFLFSLGFSPCFAVLPVFLAALALNSAMLMLTMFTFAAGVIVAFVGGSALVARGLVKLDHPMLEHHGETLVGIGVALMGLLLLWIPHTHAH